MGSRSAVRLLALLVVVCLAFATCQSAWAQGKSQLPQIKTPASERFDIAGKVTTSSAGASTPAPLNIDITVTGSGAVSGNNGQETITLQMAGGPAGQGGPPSSFSLDVVLLDGKVYGRISGFESQGINNQWYVADAPQGVNAGMFNSTSGLIPANPELAQAYTITQVGKEDVNGAPTTKYRIDIDLNKLLSGIAAQPGQNATPSATTVPPLPTINAKEQVFVWIGDSDQYLYKLEESGSTTITGNSSEQIPDTTITSNLTITFKDFNQPVTITAPPNAKPLDQSSLSGLNGSMLQGMGGTLFGNPLGVGFGTMAGMPSSVSAPSAPPPVVVGMPTTGNSSEAGLWLLAALGVASISAGALIRRKALSSR